MDPNSQTVGPKHDPEGKLICPQDCETCANRIFALHTGFFVDEFKKKVAQQHGEAIVCHDEACATCNQKPWDVVCKGCGKQTGKVRIGVLGCEILQVHPGNAMCATVLGPVKRCGCIVHVKCWLLCSQACLLSCKYSKAVAEDDRPKMEELFREEKFSIPELGPLLIHDQYVGKNLTPEELALACGTCGKREASKVCGGCNRVRYCSVDCQKAAWKGHKPVCAPLKAAQLEQLAKEAQQEVKSHRSLEATD